MNLLFVALEDHKPAPGGIAELTDALARALQEAGHTVEVLAQRMEGDQAFDRSCPYTVHRIDLPEVSVFKPHGSLRGYRAIARHLARLDPDALICNVLGHRGYLSALAAERYGCPFILLAHGNELVQPDRSPGSIKDRLFWYLARKKRDATLQRADRIVCNSRFTASVVTALGIPEERTAVVHPGCDPASLPDRPVDVDHLVHGVDLAEARVVLTVGRLVPRKGIDHAIEAVERLAETFPDLLYVVAGDGEDRDRLTQLVEQKGLEDHVVFTGYVDEAEKHGLYASSDLFLMPSRARDPGPRTGLPRSYEGFGIVFLEAALHGVPSIGGDAGGAVDAVEHGKTGLLVDPRDPEAIAEAIGSLLRDPTKAKRLGAAARERAEGTFTWQRAARDLVTVIESL